MMTFMGSMESLVACVRFAVCACLLSLDLLVTGNRFVLEKASSLKNTSLKAFVGSLRWCWFPRKCLFRVCAQTHTQTGTKSPTGYYQERSRRVKRTKETVVEKYW